MWFVIFLIVYSFMLVKLERFLAKEHGGFLLVEAATLGKIDKEPEKHRVLFYWICYYIFGIRARTPNMEIVRFWGRDNLLKKSWDFELYYIVKAVFLMFGLLTFSVFLKTIGVNHIVGTLLVCMLLPITFQNEVSDWILELLFFGLFLWGIFSGVSILWLSLIVFLGTLNRESTILLIVVGIVYLGWAGLWLILSEFLAQLILNIRYGNNPKQRIDRMFGSGLKKRLRWYKYSYIHWPGVNYIHKETITNMFHYGLMIIASYFIIMYLGWGLFSPEFDIFMVAMGIYVVLISIPGNINEVRIYLPSLFVVVPVVTKLIT